MTETAAYRLPRDARPRRYELELTPDLASFRFEGVEVVTLEVLRPVRELVCNAMELAISEARLETPAGAELAGRVALDEEVQGAVASEAYLKRLADLARRFGFLVFADECYCEVYLNGQQPRGMLEVSGNDFTNCVVFHSLSKRSNLPGLRVGFAAGDRKFLTRYIELRNVAAPQVPVPAQEVAIAAYNDETHVDKNRELYVAKFNLADQIIGDRYGYKRPPGGFFRAKRMTRTCTWFSGQDGRA